MASRDATPDRVGQLVHLGEQERGGIDFPSSCLTVGCRELGLQPSGFRADLDQGNVVVSRAGQRLGAPPLAPGEVGGSRPKQPSA